MCKRCGAEKPLSDLVKDSRYSLGHKAYCKQCSAADRVSYYHRKRGEDPLFFVKNILSSRATHARKVGVAFTLVLSDVLPVPQVCPVFGTPMAPGGDTDFSPSLDRLIPHLGYVPGNVEWISYRANRIKNDASLEEIASVHAWLLSRTAGAQPIEGQ